MKSSVSSSSVQKQPVYRVKTGCLKCRSRKKKCDERKPICRACERNKLQCQWPSTINTTFIQIRHPAKKSSTKRAVPSTISETSTESEIALEALQPPTNLAPTTQEETLFVHSPLPSLPSPDSLQNVFSPQPIESLVHDTEFTTTNDELEQETIAPDKPLEEHTSLSVIPSATSTKVVSQVTRNLAVLPDHGAGTFQLLSHYMTKTADSMSNGFNSINPFLTQLIPLAFSNELILQLLLTQSAAHRAIKEHGEFGPIANNHYSKSISLFRQYIDNYISGQEESPLMLTVGTLIMCFTETAKGDVNGAIFDHLSAANSLLMSSLTNEGSKIPLELKNFLVEYYTYTATLSMISIDYRLGNQFLLSPDIERLAMELAESRYIGHLSGCWMELLLLIPKIFDLACRWSVNDEQTPQHVENVAMFATLQSEILKWAPYPGVDRRGSLAGHIFQHSILLYLFTSLDGAKNMIGGDYDDLIEKTVDEAMSLFELFPPYEQINTGMCWPLAVIGSCISDDSRQQIIRNRLIAMHDTIGLGNMKQTLKVLELIWQKPITEAGPWNICRVMQDHQIWISFA